MVTALALQLIQCVVKLPHIASDSRPNSPVEDDNLTPSKKNQKKRSDDVSLTRLIKCFRKINHLCG